jgi:hypothetical protein
MVMVTDTKGKCLGWKGWIKETVKAYSTVLIRKKEVTMSTTGHGKTTYETELEAPVFTILGTYTWVTGRRASATVLASYSCAEAINTKASGVMT